MTAKTVDPAILNAWHVVDGFAKSVNICICGTVEDAIVVIYKTLERYPAPSSGDSWGRPGSDPQAIFNAVVLDAWGLIDHAGSIDSGAFRTDKGDVLYRALKALREPGEDFLPDPFDLPEGWEPEEFGPWWKAGAA
jgi:hypothetical protein